MRRRDKRERESKRDIVYMREEQATKFADATNEDTDEQMSKRETQLYIVRARTRTYIQIYTRIYSLYRNAM